MMPPRPPGAGPGGPRSSRRSRRSGPGGPGGGRGRPRRSRWRWRAVGPVAPAAVRGRPRWSRWRWRRLTAAVPAVAAVVPAAVAAVRGGPGGGAPAGGGGRPGGGGRGRGGGTAGAFGRPVARPVRGRKSKKQRRQEFDNMAAPTMGSGVPRGNGEVVRLPRGASLADFADKINANPGSLVQVVFNLGEMVTATQSCTDETLQLLGEHLGYDVQIVSPEDEDRELLAHFDLEFDGDYGDEDRPRHPAAGRHRHGSRRPRQDQAARRDPADRRGGRRGRRHHPAHRRLPGPRRRIDGNERRDHLHRHPGPRGVHRHACPWCPGHRHRGPRGRGRRRREAADDRGAQPRPGGRRADRGRGQQDRQGGRQPGQGPPAAHRVRPGRRGVRRRHDVRRRLRQAAASASTGCSRRSC